MAPMFKIEVIMDYKRKYKEALETARKINSGEGVAAPPDWTICEVIFPELKESEDERIRKALLDLFKIENFNGYVTLNGIDVDDVITWLEKQEPKPKWTEEDDYNVQCCIAKAERDIENGLLGRNKELIEWLNSLGQRMEGKV